MALVRRFYAAKINKWKTRTSEDIDKRKKRLYVVPETGEEANKFWAYRQFREEEERLLPYKIKIELWPGYVSLNGERKKTGVIVYEFKANHEEWEVLCSSFFPMSGGSLDYLLEKKYPANAEITFQEPFDKDRW